jgi:hypothetical protein
VALDLAITDRSSIELLNNFELYTALAASTVSAKGNEGRVNSPTQSTEAEGEKQIRAVSTRPKERSPAILTRRVSFIDDCPLHQRPEFEKKTAL